MANGDNMVKAPYSMELMTRNRDQFCEEITLDFFTEFEDFLDSSSKDEKSETSVWPLLRVPSELGVFVSLFVVVLGWVFLFFLLGGGGGVGTHNGVIEIH